MTKMRFVPTLLIFLLISGICAMNLISCGENKHSDWFAYSKPADLSDILHTYDWYKHYEGEEDKDSILFTKIGHEVSDYEIEIYLFEDTSFVLRVPEYANSNQPFLANAEDFYNSCALDWNIRSNYEVWYRGHTMDLLCDDEDVKKSIESISVNIIKDKDVQKVAQSCKDSLLYMMNTEPCDWTYDAILNPLSDIISSKAYQFYEDEETFAASLYNVVNTAEGMVMDKLQNYLDANENDQLQIMLDELSTCYNFDEQCSLWRNWANCEKSYTDDVWIIEVGRALMESGNYSPILNHIWITWRAITQSEYFGDSRDSSIPNQYYNEYRKMCYITCLKHIECHPDDIYAMNCAASLGGFTNMNRFGQNEFGNNAMIECIMMMPKRYNLADESEEE